MKKATTLLAICSMLLSGCGQIDDAESKSVTTTTTAIESTADADTTEISSTKEEKDTSEAATTALKTSSQTVSSTSKPTGTTETTAKRSGSSNVNGNSNQVQNNNGQGNNHQENNQPAQNNPQPDNSPSNDPQSNNGAEQNNRPSDNNQNNTPSPPVTTAKPAVTNPPATTTTKPQTADQKPDVTTTAPHIQDITSLNSFVQDIDTGYYQNIGKSFGSFETDYQKAKAIFDWEIDNGNGSCISYAIQTYYLCKGAGLECAYAFMTSNGWYGHVYNVVNADGNWYVFDTQGECFLGSDYIYTKIFDENENTLNIMLSENDY